MHIPEEHLNHLQEAGLLVSEPFVSGHVAFPDSVTVCKPRDAGGHSLPGYDAVWGMDGPDLDAPGLNLHTQDGLWHVTSHDYVPGPGPGDFVNVHETLEEAVADIIDFYFGDPPRMAAKQEARQRG